jgi:hypothetical protein
MAETLRHQHRKAVRDQMSRKRAIFRLRHLRAAQHILGGRMRDHRQPKRALTGGAKQHRVSGPVRDRRRHQPLLRAIRLALGPLRAESGRLTGEYDKRRERECSFEQKSHRMKRGPENKEEIRQQNTGGESNREPQIDMPTGFFAARRGRETGRANPSAGKGERL